MEKVKCDDVKKRMAHAFRTKKDIEYLLDRGLYMGKSKIDPSRTDLNIVVGYEDIRAEYDKDLAMTYHQKDSVVMHELIVTYPTEDPPTKDGVVIPPDEFFGYVVKALQNDTVFGKHFKFYGGAIHHDEVSVHMHGFLSSIEKLDKPITKVVGVKKVEKFIKSTGKTKIVEQRIKKTYDQQYNAKKMMGRAFFKEFHYMMEGALAEMGVKAELITKEVREFNAFKKKLEAEYKEKITNVSTVEEKQALLHEMFVILQGKDPKKTHKSIQEMYVEDFTKQLEEIKAQEQAKINALQQEFKSKEETLKKKNKTISTELERIDIALENITTENETLITEMKEGYEKQKKELQQDYEEQLKEYKEDIDKCLIEYYKEEYVKEMEKVEKRIKNEVQAKYQEMYDQKMKELMQSIGFSDKPSTFPAQEYDDRER